jgi:hypothetical protein
MLPLYLLAAHMVGDFALQNRWQAEQKLDDPRIRSMHVLTYTLAFVPVAAVSGAPWQEVVTFLGLLAGLHFLTDSRRFRVTLGDLAEWRTRTTPERQREWRALTGRTPIDDSEAWHRWPPPNPWPATPLALDQTLHVLQVAVLGGWLLA